MASWVPEGTALDVLNLARQAWQRSNQQLEITDAADLTQSAPRSRRAHPSLLPAIHGGQSPQLAASSGRGAEQSAATTDPGPPDASGPITSPAPNHARLSPGPCAREGRAAEPTNQGDTT